MDFFIDQNVPNPDQPFVAKEAVIDTDIDRLGDVAGLMRSAPAYYGPLFDAIAEERKHDDGSMKSGFRRVAQLVNVPMLRAMEIVEPSFLKDKRTFYAWLARHPEYRTYERKGRDHPTETFVGGKPVLWNEHREQETPAPSIQETPA
jgi:hypothetical protein